MGVNWKRVSFGGLVAGLIINAVEFLVNSILPQRDWAEALKASGKPQSLAAAVWYQEPGQARTRTAAA